MALLLAALFLLTDTICLSQLILGLPCPGCGLTRATLALLALDFPKAFQMHPLVILAWIDVAVVAILIVTGRHRKPIVIFLSFSLIALIGVYVWRMTTLYPHIQPMVPFKDALVNQIVRRFNH